MEYKIPLFSLNYGEEEENAVLETLRSRWISMGPKCAELEGAFVNAFGAKHAVSVTNCTTALHLCLLALGIGEGDEVIVPSFTFVATVNAVKYVRAKPVFCDILSIDEPVISAENIQKLVTGRTKAVIVMHYAGFACNMAPIMTLAKKHGLKVVEDACHGPLSEYRGRKLGTIGDAGCFSFFSNKNISTGEGGIITVNSAALEKKLRLLRSHGMTVSSYDKAKGHAVSYDVKELGYNYRLDDIRASIALAQLKKLPADMRARRGIRRLYIEKLEGIKGVRVPFKEYKEVSSCYIMPVVLEDSNPGKREKIRIALAKKGIQTSVHYPAVHLFGLYRQKGLKLPVTEYVSGSEITLPLYGRLGKEEVLYVCDNLKLALRQLR